MFSPIRSGYQLKGAGTNGGKGSKSKTGGGLSPFPSKRRGQKGGSAGPLPYTAGLVLQLDPATLSLANGANVTAWADQSGNGNDASEATNPPTYDDGSRFGHGRPGVKFDAVAEQLVVASDPTIENANCTYVSVVLPVQMPSDRTSATSYVWLWNKQNANPATIGARWNDGSPEAFMRTSALLQAGGDVSRAAITPGLQVHILRKNGSRMLYQIACDGNLMTVGEVTDASNIATGTTNPLYIGKHPTVDNGMVMERVQYDFLVYDADIGDTEVQNIVDWANGKYPFFAFEKAAAPFAAAYFGSRITVVGTTAYLVGILNSDKTKAVYRTASTADPHNWSAETALMTLPAEAGSATLVWKSSTSEWLLYYDTRNFGAVRYAKGSSLAAMVDQGAIFTAGGGTFWRHPFVLGPADTHDGNFHMLVDRRTASATSGFGDIYHATSADGETWTWDTANNPILSPTADESFEALDVGGPTAYWTGSTYRVFWAGFQRTGPLFPHFIGEGTSSDLSSVTRKTSIDQPLVWGDQSSAGTDNLGQSVPTPYSASDGFWLYATGDSNVAGTQTPSVQRYLEK